MPFRQHRRSMRAVLPVLVLTLAACSSTPRPTSEKPSAAVNVEISAVDLGGGDHEITFRATPTRDVAALELVLDGKRSDAGATRAGQARTLTARVHVEDGKGLDVVGSARVDGRNKAALVHVGAADTAAPVETNVVTMPDGVQVEEVRP
jgi:hypothetical protein